MPRPTSGTTIQRPDLGVVAYETMLDMQQSSFIGVQLAPVFETAEKTADYPKIPIEALLDTKETKRAARSAYNRSDWEFETGTFNCQDNGWEEMLDDSERRLYTYLFDSEVVCMSRAVHKILMNHEIRVAALAFNTSNWANGAVTTEWDTAASATPHKDVTVTGYAGFKAVAGVEPNTGVCSRKVFNVLLNTDEVKDALKYTDPIEMGGFMAQKQAMAMYFGLDRLLVGGGSKGSSDKKGQTLTPTDIWDDEYFGLYRVEQSMDLEAPQAMRTFLWNADSPGMLVTEQYREEGVRSEIYRVRHNVDEAQIFAGAGYLLTNIHT